MDDLFSGVRIEDLEDDQKQLANVLGMEAYRKLVLSFSGAILYVPKVESVVKAARDRLIREQYDGTNVRELAKRFGLTENWIRVIVSEKAKELKRKPIEGQLSLFDYPDS